MIRAILSFAVIVLLCNQTTYAQSNFDTNSCSNYEIIYVRGSGQKINAKEGEPGYEDERDTLKALVSKFVNNVNAYAFVELGDPHTTGFGSYPAVSVTEENRNVGVVAILSNGNIGAYARSVSEGVQHLDKYLKHSHATKRDTCFILSGYSQGAHVVGNVINLNSANYDLLNKTKYIGMIGDPKLDLHGLGLVAGSNVPWQRGSAISFWDGGSLGSRRPYVPHNQNAPVIPTGSWCYNDDPVCSSNFTNDGSAHGKYGERGGISHMALEIANIINNPAGVSKATYPKETCGGAKQDIVVLLDTSPLMRREGSLFSDTRMYYGAKTGQLLPTAGQMFTRSGCGDVRLAVVGYGRESDGAPQELLGFTKNAAEYDALLKSLYQPAAKGTFERTQFREGALKAADVTWRPDAEKIVFALSDIAGSGEGGSSSWRGWDDQATRETYLSQSLSQQMIETFRAKNITLMGMAVSHGKTGFNPAITEDESTDFRSYLGMMAKVSGGYVWPKMVPNYHGYDFKYSLLDESINSIIQARSKTSGSVSSARGVAGERMTLTFNDTLGMLQAAKLRGDSVNYEWYVSCDKLHLRNNNLASSLTFTPNKAGKCTGSVEVSVRGQGAGCYLTNICPEPFPPYMKRSFPFAIDIKPSGYVAKVPGAVTNLKGIVSSDTVVITWDAPPYNSNERIVYVVREQDGTVLAATTARELIMTETNNTIPEVTIAAAGEDGQSQPISSLSTQFIDIRPVEQPEPVVNETSEQSSFAFKTPDQMSMQSSTQPVLVESTSQFVSPIFVAQTSDSVSAVLQTGDEAVLAETRDSMAAPNSDTSHPSGTFARNINSAGGGENTVYGVVLVTVFISAGLLLRRFLTRA